MPCQGFLGIFVSPFRSQPLPGFVFLTEDRELDLHLSLLMADKIKDYPIDIVNILALYLDFPSFLRNHFHRNLNT